MGCGLTLEGSSPLPLGCMACFATELHFTPLKSRETSLLNWVDLNWNCSIMYTASIKNKTGCLLLDQCGYIFKLSANALLKSSQ